MRVDKPKNFFKNLNLAEGFCNGNKKKAQMLLNGEFKDIIIIKGRFDSEGEEYYGFFLTFISKVFYTVVLNYTVFTNYTVALMNKPIYDWKTFYAKLEKVITEDEHDLSKDNELNYKIKNAINMKTVIGLIEDVNDNNIGDLTNKFKQIMSTAMGEDKIDVDLDYEETTSLILNEKWNLKPPDK